MGHLLVFLQQTVGSSGDWLLYPAKEESTDIISARLPSRLHGVYMLFVHILLWLWWPRFVLGHLQRSRTHHDVHLLLPVVSNPEFKRSVVEEVHHHCPDGTVRNHSGAQPLCPPATRLPRIPIVSHLGIAYIGCISNSIWQLLCSRLHSSAEKGKAKGTINKIKLIKF